MYVDMHGVEGGRGIIRVEVSTDGGNTWKSVELKQDPEQDLVLN